MIYFESHGVSSWYLLVLLFGIMGFFILRNKRKDPTFMVNKIVVICTFVFCLGYAIYDQIRIIRG